MNRHFIKHSDISVAISKLGSFLKAKAPEVEAAASVAETIDPALSPVSTLVDDVAESNTIETPVSAIDRLPTSTSASGSTIETRLAAIEASVAKFESLVPGIEGIGETFAALISDVKSFNALKAITDGQLLVQDVDGELPAIKLDIADVIAGVKAI